MLYCGRKAALFVLAGASLGSLAYADVVFTYPHNGTGALIASSWVFENGSDADMYAYDDFTLNASQTITEVRWRGGYGYGAPYGRVFNFSITFYESIAGGYQPHCNNPQLPEIYLAWYDVGGNAGETPAGVFGGVSLYDYSYVLPTPFTAAAGTKYWVRIEGYQSVYPDWGLAVGTGGDGRHFAFSTGAAQFFFASGETAFALVAPAVHHGDLNCDGTVTFADINPFVLALSDPAGYQSTYPSCNFGNGDINADGTVNFADINPFVALLTGP